jgi:hypothetical protein
MSSPPETELRGRRHSELAPAQLGVAATSKSLPLATVTYAGTGQTQPGQKGGHGYADDMIIMALQAATHWNALSHMFYDYHMYNHRHCSLVNSVGAMKNSIAVAAASIVSRAIPLDFPRTLEVPWLLEDHAITCAGPIPFSRAVGAPVNPIVMK